MLICDDVLCNGTLRDLPTYNCDDKEYLLISICPPSNKDILQSNFDYQITGLVIG